MRAVAWIRRPAHNISCCFYKSAFTPQSSPKLPLGFGQPPLFRPTPRLSRANLRLSRPPLSKSYHTSTKPQIRQASTSTPFLVAAVVVSAGALYWLLFPQSTPTSTSPEDELIELIDDEMSQEQLPGRPGNLTAEQEEKLRQMWTRVFQICNVVTEEPSTEPAEVDGNVEGKQESPEKKKKRSLFSRKGKKDGAGAKAADVAPGVKGGEDDKYGETKAFMETLANQSPESIRAAIWGMVKHDHPDAILLRFLRARKWDVEKALVMMISTMNWRSTEYHVDDDIMKNGEGAAAEEEKSSDAATKKLASDFLAQMRMGKSFLHGKDKQGRPICVVRVRLHHQGDHDEKALERYTVFIIETCRQLLKPPVDTATIVFDMTDFSMQNMDYNPVKFMIKCFEANYPECLGTVLVHKSPWIFQGIWRIIKGWLDPVVASKVHFTNNANELEEFIPRNQIMKELGGDEDYTYSYVEPVPGENDKMKDTATRDTLLAAREALYKQYEDATLDWIHEPEGEKGQTLKASRNAVAAKLRDGYWQVDPYIRARSFYDRTGVLQADGKVDFYPSAAPAAAVPAPTNGGGAVETSADDLD